MAPENVAEVRIRLGKGSIQNVGWPYTPTTVTSAQLNLHYVAAIMMLENDVFVDQFTAEKICAPHVLAMIDRIKITHDPALDGYDVGQGNPVEVVLKDGTELQAWGCVRGGAENPIPPEEVIQKFRKMTTPHISTAAQEELIDLCGQLETVADATRLVELMQPH